jgi:hypothetical protein
MSLTSGVTAGRGHPFATRELQPPIIVALPASSPSDELGGSWRRPAARTDYSINLLTVSYRSETAPETTTYAFAFHAEYRSHRCLNSRGEQAAALLPQFRLDNSPPDAQEIDEAVPINTVSTFGGPDDPPVVVADELLDALVKAVVTPPDARARSAVICILVHTMFAAVGWLHDSDTTPDDASNDELASVGQLATAAQDHQLRMRLSRITR